MTAAATIPVTAVAVTRVKVARVIRKAVRVDTDRRTVSMDSSRDAHTIASHDTMEAMVATSRTDMELRNSPLSQGSTESASRRKACTRRVDISSVSTDRAMMYRTASRMEVTVRVATVRVVIVRAVDMVRTVTDRAVLHTVLHVAVQDQ